MKTLIDQLNFFNTRVPQYDQSLKENFTVKAALMWTIRDFFAMSMISGWSG